MREKVEEQLNKLTAPDSLLWKDSPRATKNLYSASDLGRIKFRNQVVEEYIENQPKSDRNGRAAIVTAGPPGAGKSTEIGRLGLAEKGWRVIDSDVIKSRLLQKAHEDGIYEDILRKPLADGHSIMLNELIALVHWESTKLADMVFDRCLTDQANVVMEGTLSWNGLPGEYLRKLTEHDYRELTVLDVEVDCNLALSQASDRWWTGRCEAINGSGPASGGRFTPRAAITGLYKPGKQASVCNINAVGMFRDSRTDHLDTFRLIVQNRLNDPCPEDVYISQNGQIQGVPPDYI